jgi:hypothetical protein
LRIESLDPHQGPLTGETRVTVRVGPLLKWINKYPRPRCRFGNDEVLATYVKCPREPLFLDEKEGRGGSQDLENLTPAEIDELRKKGKGY